MIDLDPQAHLSLMFLKISTILNVRDGSLQMAQNLYFQIRHVGFGSSGVKADLIPSGLNYILEVFRGQIPSQDPFALYSRISREPATNKYYNTMYYAIHHQNSLPPRYGVSTRLIM